MLGRKGRFDHKKSKSSHEDLRVSPRYKAIEDAAWLGWSVKSEFQTCHALILDVSLRGALIAADELPNAERVWICLDGPTPTDWIEARVVNVVRTSLGPHKVGLSFETNCPYAFFKAAVYGFESLNLRTITEPEPEKHLYGPDWW